MRLATERAAGGILLPSSVTAKRANAELKNELIREILKNSKNLDEPQRARILQDVLERARVDAGGADGGVHGDAVINDVIMQELVSQMDALPQSVGFFYFNLKTKKMCLKKSRIIEKDKRSSDYRGEKDDCAR